MKKRVITKWSYLGLSVGIATLIIFTALPYYLLTSISFPGWNIYWSYEYVQQRMLRLFPGMALLGAVTTLRKKKYTLEDIFLNVAAPLIVLLTLKVAQYHLMFVVVLLSITAVAVITKCTMIWLDDRFEKMKVWKKIRICYYRSRRFLYILLIVLAPMAVFTAFHESRDRSEYLTLFSSSVEVDAEEEQADLVWNIVDEEAWDDLTTEARFNEIQKLTGYFLQDLGVPGVNIYAVKELTDETLAYYNEADESIRVNAIYLSKCSLRDAAFLLAHECEHRQQYQIIKGVEMLKEAGINYEEFKCFSEAVDLYKAFTNYGADSLSYDTYSKNLLEIRSNEYADEMVKRLQEYGYLK